MDLKRILTTLLGLPAVIALCLFGNEYVMAGVIFTVSCICMHEYFGVVKKVSKPIEWVAYLSNIFILWAAMFEFSKLSKIIILAIPFIILILFMQVIFTNMKTTFKDVAYTLLGIMYIPFFLMFLEQIRCMEHGKILIGYTLVVSWSTDIAAYLIGRKFGKHKLSKISPKKSVEGSVAGIIGAVVMAILYTLLVKKLWNVEYSYVLISIISFILSIVSQIGDFVASSIKRFVDVKDYGTILPGHGGMLDRIDSLLFLAPFTYLIFMFI